MEIKKTILGILILILLIPTALAISIDIDVKESFSINEKVSFSYTIISEKSQEIEYSALVNCPNAPFPLLEIKTTNLEANIPFTETYPYLIVREEIEPQTCEAVISILKPEEISEKKSFSIETNPSFEFNVLTCKDSSCAEKTKVFILNKNIYLDFISEVSEPTITSTLIYPDKKTRKITLPTSIKADQIGTYELEVTASKEGYKTINKKIQFGVIEKEANIPYTKVESIKPKEILSQKNIWYIVIPAIFIIFTIILIIYFKKRKQAIIYNKYRKNRNIIKRFK